MKTLIETPSFEDRIRRARLAWIAEVMRHVFVQLPDRVVRMGKCPPHTTTTYDAASGRQRCLDCSQLL